MKIVSWLEGQSRGAGVPRGGLIEGVVKADALLDDGVANAGLVV